MYQTFKMFINLLILASSDYNTSSFDVIFGANAVITTVVVPIIDDNIGELDEVFYGTLTNVGSSNVQITADQAEIHVIDDDGKYDKVIFTCSIHMISLFAQFGYGLILHLTLLMKMLE